MIDYSERVRTDNAVDFLQSFKTNSVDAIITDPPYGVNYDYWDEVIPPQKLLDECLRVARGPIIFFGAAPVANISSILNYNPQPDRIIIWSPRFTLSHTQKNNMFFRWHPIYVWRFPETQSQLSFDIITHPTETGNWWKHAATKPLRVMLDLVRAFGGESIIDPFCGSGTTLVAAVLEGIEFHGCDINSDYVQIAIKRLQQHDLESPIDINGIVQHKLLQQ